MEGILVAIEERFYNICDNIFELSEEQVNILSFKKIVEIKNKTFKFVYVGLIAYEDKLLFSAPKYYDNPKEVLFGDIRRILSVLKKSNKWLKNPGTLFLNGNYETLDHSEIVVADFMLHDLLSNGKYRKLINQKKMNTNKQTDWKRTQEIIWPVFSNGSPIYPDTYHISVSEDANSGIIVLYNMLMGYFKDKYASILGYSFEKEMPKSQYMQIKSVNNIRHYISIISDELSFTFNDRLVQVLKAMKCFFEQMDIQNNYELHLYGTNSFHLVWEDCCKYIMTDEYEKYKSKFPVPEWKATYGVAAKNDKNMMEPDIIRKHGDIIFIFDAKYYLIKLTKDSVSGNPASYDIVKQYVYQLALEEYGDVLRYINALLFPKISDDIYEVFGEVELSLFKRNSILCINISVNGIFDRYISGRPFTEEELEVLIEICKEYQGRGND